MACTFQTLQCESWQMKIESSTQHVKKVYIICIIISYHVIYIGLHAYPYRNNNLSTPTRTHIIYIHTHTVKHTHAHARARTYPHAYILRKKVIATKTYI